MHGNSFRFTSSTVAAVLAVLVALALPAAAQLPWTNCGESGYFTQNSTYQANLELASTVLPRNASSAAASLFAAGRVGAAPDVVYALALCRGDTSSSTCAACLAVAFPDAQQLCAYSKEVAIYYDLCYLRFSSVDFLSVSGSGTDTDEMRLRKVENVSAPAAAFDAAVGALLNATADRAAADPSRRFATGVEAFGGSVPAIYALAQCTPDMTPAGCRSCLADITQMATKYFSGSPSGRVIRVRCNYRYELQQFFSGTPLLQLPAPVPAPARPWPPPSAQMTENLTPSANGEGRRNRVAKVSAAVACPLLLLLIGLAFVFILLKRRKSVKGQNTPVLIVSKKTPTPNKIDRAKCTVFDLPTLKEATNNFHEKNKLGEGGFGTVYRGKLSNGHEIAVKKLSRCTGQGLNQLHNEVQLLAELQHKKLVRLLGFCSHRDEMMLVYEHVKNGSLDKFLFDTSRRKGLNWEHKCNIILGIAKGILYLHEDSSLRIVHRDLKANNILLDENMNPKIADFGLARLLGGGHTQTKTTNVAGTYGYMPPEYALFGKVSPKTDVFSFGVLVLEIITGRRNSSSNDRTVNLLTEVWNCWTKGTVSPLINESLDGHTKSKVVRCIHIGLLCVQEYPDDRPNISSVIVMLTRSRIKLQPPRQPAFFFGRDYSSVADHRVHGRRNSIYERSDVIVDDAFSMNDVTNTDPFPR